MYLLFITARDRYHVVLLNGKPTAAIQLPLYKENLDNLLG